MEGQSAKFPKLYLHVFHPKDTWSCWNAAEVRLTEDYEGWEEYYRSEWGMRHREGFTPFSGEILHDVYEIKAGMKLESQGYDWAYLVVNGEAPRQNDVP